MARTPVEEIKERLSIIDVVGRYVELQKAGKHYKGKSPFTNEKTPSFFVSPDRGVYYCFSSQKGGDMFTFIQEMEGVDFKGALKILAEEAHIELVPEDAKKRNARETLYALLEETTKYFFAKRESNEQVNAYLAERGVKGETVHTWRIGYAPDEWRSLKTHLQEKGFTETDMLKAGVIKKTDPAKESYDVFRDRIMFPIADASGRVVAFSGRTLKKDSDIPKYVNSPETELFVKSEILYGYDKAKHGIRHYDFSLIVEGQFDVVLAHQSGYANTVAVSGTALTEHHIMLLLRLSNRVVLALDADRAGVSAVKRSALPMLEQGMDVKVAHMPDGADPADIIKRDPHEFKKIVGNAVHVIEFLLKILKVVSKDDRTYKLRTREEIIPLLLGVQNHIDREHFEGVIAEAIDTTKEAIHYEAERLSAEYTHRPTLTIGNEPIVKKVSTPNRRAALFAHLYAITHVVDGDLSWIKDALTPHIEVLISNTERSELTEENNQRWQETLFAAERYLEDTDARQLIDDVSDKITALSHLVARENLASLREAMREAENEENDEVLAALHKEVKMAETYLQSRISIEKPKEKD